MANPPVNTPDPNVALPEDDPAEVDTLAPEYQGLLSRAYAYVNSGDEKGLESWLKSVRPDQRGQVIDDTLSILHSHKVYLIRSLLGDQGVRRLNRDQKDAVLGAVAQASNNQTLQSSLLAIDPKIQFSQTANVAQWRDYAARILRGISMIQKLMIKPELEEHLTLLRRFSTRDQEHARTLRNELEGVLRTLGPGTPLGKTTLDSIGQVLTKAGFAQQSVTELLARDSRVRLLQAARKLHTALSIVDNYYGNNRAQEDALQAQLLALRLRR